MKQDPVKFYRSKDNLAISNSKLSDWLKSPEYFKARYIDGTVKNDPTPSMVLGSMVDAAWSAGSLKAIHKKWFVKERGLKVRGKEGVTQSQWDNAQGIATALMREPFDKDMRQCESHFQEPLYAKIVDIPVCGMPDWWTPYASWCNGPAIVDLKVSSADTDERRWKWNCEAMNYERQLALYRYLVADKLGVPTESIHCYHVVAGSRFDGKWPITLFEFDGQILDHAFEELVYQLGRMAESMAKNEFVDKPITWNDLLHLTCA